MSFWQRAVEDPTAVGTFILALATFAAIIVPIWQRRQENQSQARRAHEELVSLLTAINVALGESTAEPAWAASAGLDIVVTRILQADIMSTLPSPIGQRVVNAVMRAERHLHDYQRREQGRTHPGILAELKVKAVEIRTNIQQIQAEVQALDKR